MANSEAGWTKEFPHTLGVWHWSKGWPDSADIEAVMAGENVAGHTLIYRVGEDSGYTQRRCLDLGVEFLGPISLSDTEQLIELRKAHDSVLRDLKQAAFAYHVEANHKPSAFADCRNGICANACRVFNAHVESNPKQPERETQSK